MQNTTTKRDPCEVQSKVKAFYFTSVVPSVTKLVSMEADGNTIPGSKMYKYAQNQAMVEV